MQLWMRLLLVLFRRNCATALALAGILAGATVVARLAAALALAGILALAIVLCLLRRLGLLGCIVSPKQRRASH